MLLSEQVASQPDATVEKLQSELLRWEQQYHASAAAAGPAKWRLRNDFVAGTYASLLRSVQVAILGCSASSHPCFIVMAVCCTPILQWMQTLQQKSCHLYHVISINGIVCMQERQAAEQRACHAEAERRHREVTILIISAMILMLILRAQPRSLVANT